MFYIAVKHDIAVIYITLYIFIDDESICIFVYWDTTQKQ